MLSLPQFDVKWKSTETYIKLMADSFKNSRPKTTGFYLHNAKIASENLNRPKTFLLSQPEKVLNRIRNLQQSTLKDKLDAFIIFNSFNLIYFTDFSGATALLIPRQGEGVLYVSSVNYEQAKAETKGLSVELLKRGENLMEKIGNRAALNNPTKLAVDTVSIEGWRALAKSVGGEEKLEQSGNVVHEMRKMKDKDEIELIREACNLANIGMQAASQTIRPGVKEKEVAAEVEYEMRKRGSDGTSFDTIIASGASSAFPHGSCSDRTIQEGDLVVVDLGATYRFYRSDMTRTFIAGKASERQIKIYETVKLAQQKACQTMKSNIPAKDVDAAARQVIKSSGFGEFFVHNLGHGVGLEIHEAPILSPDSKDILVTGNVVTDEPGIYLPGFGGVRIEDTILVTNHGAEKLTNGFYTLETKP
jgi:Xaa-Pro dipeptidase